MNIYQTLNTQTLYKIATYTLVRKKKTSSIFPPNSPQTKPRKFIKNTKPKSCSRSQAKHVAYCFTLEYCIVECSFVDKNNNTVPMIQSIVNFVFLISSRTNRENLAQKLRLPYSDGFGVKKIPF